MYSRAVSHFNTDIKKMKTMLNELTNVDFVETGSELISLLKESEEIKKHKPFYNKKSKVDVFTHSIVYAENEKGILTFEIVNYDEERPALHSFTNYSAARERLEKWIDEKELCLQYCGLTSETSVCFNHQIKKCRGICAEQESMIDYNKRAKKLLQEILFSKKDFMILDVGRTPEEKSFIWVRDYQFHGFGYIDESAQIFNQDDLYEFTHSKTYYPDCDDIVRSWLKTKQAKIVVF
jgi:DNA polymerase-3 subunit epsilon